MLDFSKVKAERLSKIYDVSRFDCGDDDLNDFIKNDAFVYQEKKLATTTLFFYEEKLIGFFSVAADSLKLNFDEKENYGIHQKKLEDIPSIKLARLAVDKNYQKQGVGTNILKWCIGYILDCSEMVAIRFITVDAYPEKVNFYRNFIVNQNRHYTKKTNHISMRYDLLNKEFTSPSQNIKPEALLMKL
ncbi:MAG: GNAT family N-acetyltransferase [Nanoarchaeota archaeon]|nr:GNAT family N-acetyltransferase [Nanoarchaeota archaeon]